MNIPQPIMRNKDQNDKKEKKLKKKNVLALKIKLQ